MMTPVFLGSTSMSPCERTFSNRCFVMRDSTAVITAFSSSLYVAGVLIDFVDFSKNRSFQQNALL